MAPAPIGDPQSERARRAADGGHAARAEPDRATSEHAAVSEHLTGESASGEFASGTGLQAVGSCRTAAIGERSSRERISHAGAGHRAAFDSHGGAIDRGADHDASAADLCAAVDARDSAIDGRRAAATTRAVAR